MWTIFKKIFRKSIRIPYEDALTYPSLQKAKECIVKYCNDAGWEYEFFDDEVMVEKVRYKIVRRSGYSHGGCCIDLLEVV